MDQSRFPVQYKTSVFICTFYKCKMRSLISRLAHIYVYYSNHVAFASLKLTVMKTHSENIAQLPDNCHPRQRECPAGAGILGFHLC